MTLEFTVEQKENGMLLRDFLRKRGVSAALAKGVKASNGFFRDGAPVHTDMRLSAGQRISFALPPEPPEAFSSLPAAARRACRLPRTG